MVLPNPVIGSQPWGAVLNARLDDLQSQIDQRPVQAGWQATDQGLLVWTYDVSAAVNSSALTAGVLAVARVVLRRAATISNLYMNVATGGVTLTAGQNFGALYDAAGTRVGVTADQSASWTSVGLKTMALTVPYNALAGYYWVAMLANGATPPSLSRGSIIAAVNAGAAGATLRYAQTGAGLTTAPASFVPAGLTASSLPWWMAVS